MAGTTVSFKKFFSTLLGTMSGTPVDGNYALYLEFNKVITDLETLRAGIRETISVDNEDLAAGADIAARPFYQAKVAETVLDSVVYIPQANSVGVDGSNTLVITLRNVTEGVDIATVTRTTNLVAGTPVALTLTAANADIAASDVLGLTITQGATADVGTGVLQFEKKRQTIDAAADMTAAALNAT